MIERESPPCLRLAAAQVTGWKQEEEGGAV